MVYRKKTPATEAATVDEEQILEALLETETGGDRQDPPRPPRVQKMLNDFDPVIRKHGQVIHPEVEFHCLDPESVRRDCPSFWVPSDQIVPTSYIVCPNCGGKHVRRV